MDLFAAHTWQDVSEPAQEAPPERERKAPPTVARATFEVAAVWRFDGQRPIVILEQQGRTWVMCEACDSPGRIRPGEPFAGEYRLEKIGVDSLTYTLVANSQTETLNLPVPLRRGR
jgi:hypothetical protein